MPPAYDRRSFPPDALMHAASRSRHPLGRTHRPCLRRAGDAWRADPLTRTDAANGACRFPRSHASCPGGSRDRSSPSALRGSGPVVADCAALHGQPDRRQYRHQRRRNACRPLRANPAMGAWLDRRARKRRSAPAQRSPREEQRGRRSAAAVHRQRRNPRHHYRSHAQAHPASRQGRRPASRRALLRSGAPSIRARPQ